jgi:hypothetical protein
MKECQIGSALEGNNSDMLTILVPIHVSIVQPQTII